MNFISSNSVLPITLRKDVVSHSFKMDDSKAEFQKILIHQQLTGVADAMFVTPQDCLIVVTNQEIVCVSRKNSIKWRCFIQDRFHSSVAFVPNQSKVIFYSENTIQILEAETGKSIKETKKTLEPLIKPLVRVEDFLCIVNDQGNKAICCFDFELKEKWKHSIMNDFSKIQLFDSYGRAAYVLDKSLWLETEKIGNFKEEIKFQFPIQVAFQIPTTHEIYLISKEKLYILGKYEHRRLENSVDLKSLTGNPVVLPSEQDWKGFVCPMLPQNISSGIYKYPLGFFDKSGNCTREIAFDYPIQYLLVDANNTIIILTGPPIDAYKIYNTYYDMDYSIYFYNEASSEIRKITIDKASCPITGPMTITASGELASFSKGELLLFRNSDPLILPPVQVTTMQEVSEPHELKQQFKEALQQRKRLKEKTEQLFKETLQQQKRLKEKAKEISDPRGEQGVVIKPASIIKSTIFQSPILTTNKGFELKHKEAIDPKNWGEPTPLQGVVEKGHVKTIKTRIEKAEVKALKQDKETIDPKSWGESTLLQGVIVKGHAKAIKTRIEKAEVKTLKQEYKETIDPKSWGESTLLQGVVEKGRVKEIKTRIEKVEAKALEQKYKEIKAIKTRMEKAGVKTLKQKHKEVTDPISEDGQTPSLFAH